jgi:hypothetical protein
MPFELLLRFLPLLPEGQVTGRGCSTKDKVFYKECETHSYGDLVEKMCFCSFFLCNGANANAGSAPNAALMAALALAAVAANCSGGDWQDVFR